MPEDRGPYVLASTETCPPKSPIRGGILFPVASAYKEDFHPESSKTGIGPSSDTPAGWVALAYGLTPDTAVSIHIHVSHSPNTLIPEVMQPVQAH